MGGLQVHAPPAIIDLFPGARLMVRTRRVLGSSDPASVLGSNILPCICGRPWAVDFFPTSPGVVADLYFVSLQGLDPRKFPTTPLGVESFCLIPGGRHDSSSSSYSLKLLLPMREDCGKVPGFHACLWAQPVSSLPPVFPGSPSWVEAPGKESDVSVKSLCLELLEIPHSLLIHYSYSYFFLYPHV